MARLAKPLIFLGAMVLVAVTVSLYFFPAWRSSPETVVALIAASACATVALGSGLLQYLHLWPEVFPSASRTAEPAAEVAVFKDVPQSHWAYREIGALVKADYFVGCGRSLFAPEEDFTREQMAVIGKRLAHNPRWQPAQPTEQTYSDVPLEWWSNKWACAAHQEGILVPRVETADSSTRLARFCPAEPVKRGEFARLLWLGVRGPGSNLPTLTASVKDVAVDNPQAQYIHAVLGEGWMELATSDPVSLFAPERPIARAEVAIALYKALVAAGKIQTAA